MAIKKFPKMLNLSSLTSKQLEEVKQVVEFINKRGSTPTVQSDVYIHLGIDNRAAYQALDLAWECGLITKVVYSRSCHWISRDLHGPNTIDENRRLKITIEPLDDL